jgi:putative GTP pyrophosphokinase
MQRAKATLLSLLRGAVASIEDRTLVRAHVIEPRIKSMESLRRKAARERWNTDEALSRCGDLVGGRVICNNTEDVYRFAELLREHLPSDGDAFEIQDWIVHPNERGYRALHVNFTLEGGDTIVPDRVPCEVQIRTRLQDAWAELTHDDIYKQPDLPRDLVSRSADLADLLATAERAASGIRRRAVEESTAPAQRPDLRIPNADALAFVFKEVFGRSPPDYVIRQAINICEELATSSLEKLQQTMTRAEFRKKLDETYNSIMPGHLRPEQVILAALYAMERGDPRALSYVRREARKEFREIDAIYRREVLSSLPDTVDELIADLDAGETDLEEWATALDALHDCGVCGTAIVRPAVLAEALMRHYEPRDSERVRADIERAIYRSGIECGAWDGAPVCSYHAAQADRD